MLSLHCVRYPLQCRGWVSSSWVREIPNPQRTPLLTITDQTVVNGAQIFYKHQFGIGDDSSRSAWLVGLVNSAPYLCCALISSWLTVPFNHWFGRRGTIFIACALSAITCLWQGFVATWWAMFVARFMLGFGIGPKSATVPIYAAETAPPSIRGALVMQWQVWSAFGIMVGYAADLIFYNVNSSSIVGLNWRCMMASAMFPALVVCCFVFTCPESPHWYMRQKQYYRAYRSICTLRNHKIQAARDLYYMHTLLEAENNMNLGRNKMLELIKVPRNRRAMLASQIVMFMQQVSVEFQQDIPNQLERKLTSTVLWCQRYFILLFRDISRGQSKLSILLLL